MSATAILLATAMLAGDHPDAERQRRLKPYFTPPPGSAVHVDAAEDRDYGRVTDWTKLRGQITVTPPRGQCLTLHRSDDQEDLRLCKRTVVYFTLDALDRTGALRWSVSTGDGDFGTELVWPSPYRMITAVGTGKDQWRDPVVRRFIASCSAERLSTGRRIRLQFFGGERWTVLLPALDFQPVQPPATDNLQVETAGRTGIGDAVREEKAGEAAKVEDAKEAKVAADDKAAKKEAKEAKEAKEEAPKTGKKTAEKGGEEKTKEAPEAEGKAGTEGAAPAKKPDEVPYEGDDRRVWAIPWRGAFVTNAAAFQPYGSVPPGIDKGRCRYIYTGPPEDPGTGRMECHEVDGFASVILPLTCLKDVQPE